MTDYLNLPIKSAVKQEFKEVVILLKHDTEVRNLQQRILRIEYGENMYNMTNCRLYISV